MAKVKGPALSLEASGNLGAICYSRWRGLRIARDVWTGTYPGTSAQIEVNNRMTTVSQAWGNTLTEAQREAWREAARSQVWKSELGDTWRPSGYNYFCRQNLNRLMMGLGIMTIPPAAVPDIYCDEFELKWEATTMVVMMQLKGFVTGAYPDQVQYFKAGPYDSQGRRPIEGEWRYYDKQLPGSWLYDYDVVIYKWYWYRARWFTNEGFVGNWFPEQVYTGS